MFYFSRKLIGADPVQALPDGRSAVPERDSIDRKGALIETRTALRPRIPVDDEIALGLMDEVEKYSFGGCREISLKGTRKF